MNTATTAPTPPLSEEERLLRYGYRLVPRTLPDGRSDFDHVALTLEDLLHPQMGDVAVESSVDDLEKGYLSSVFRAQLVNDPHALVLADCGINWDIPDLRLHSPDVSLIFDVREQRPNWPSFDVAQEGTRPTLIVEIVSPDSRDNDVVAKVEEYHQARVPFYYIVDRRARNDPPSLLGYRWTPQEYEPLSPDDDGRFWLSTVGIWLGVEDDKVACYDGQTRERLGNYTEIAEDLKASRKHAKNETRRANREEKLRLEAERNIEKEVQLRQALEVEIAELRAELHRRSKNGSGN